MSRRVNKRNVLKAVLAIFAVLILHKIIDFFDGPDTCSPPRTIPENTNQIENVAVKPKKSKLKKEALEKLSLNNEDDKPDKSDDYALDISLERMNRLFDILYEKEKTYADILSDLNVVSFQKLFNGEADKALDGFEEESNAYLKIENSKVRASKMFLKILHKKSSLHTFRAPRDKVVKAKVEEVNIFYLLKSCHLNFDH
jgi:hypothetical protein